MRYIFCIFILFCTSLLQSEEGIAGKIFTGYQGWFRCEGDGSNNGWYHYGSRGKWLLEHTGIEMWPDVSELPPEDRFASPFLRADGKTAEVFSSYRESTVDMHFRWMKEYGIDVAMLQRFVTNTRDDRFRKPMDTILLHCQKQSAKHGRHWALMYDFSGVQAGESDVVKRDWLRLKESGFSAKGSYFPFRGKPMIALWGIGFNDRPEMLEDWEKVIDFFQQEGCAIMLGVPYHWRTLDGDAIHNQALLRLLRRAQVISPWSVGRLATPQDAMNRIEARLKPDRECCEREGIEYLPVIFPGFSWHNLQKSRGRETPKNQIPRKGGEFIWTQAMAARNAGAKSLYLAMFDELDEGTAIFKTDQNPPLHAANGGIEFIREADLPSDHYLWLAGKIGEKIRSPKVEAEEKMPVR